MRKLLILAGALVFLAAACNSQGPAVSTSTQPKTSGAKVDAAVEAMNKSVDAEDSVNMQSDNDIVTSDQSVINGYNGVSNASSY